MGVFFALLFLACGSVQEKPTGVVYVLESTRAKTIGRATYPVYVDEVLTANLDGGRYVVLKLPEGEHSFHSKHKKKGGVLLNVKAGEIYYVRLNVEEGGFFLRDDGMTTIPKEEGAYSVRQLKPIKRDYIKNRSFVDLSEVSP